MATSKFAKQASTIRTHSSGPVPAQAQKGVGYNTESFNTQSFKGIVSHPGDGRTIRDLASGPIPPDQA